MVQELKPYSRKITDLESGNRGRDSESLSGLLDNGQYLMGEAEYRDSRWHWQSLSKLLAQAHVLNFELFST